MPSKLLFLLLFSFVVLFGVTSADILGDLFKWDIMGAFTGGDEDDDDSVKREDEDTGSQSSCECAGPGCNCCVDFNITSIIDLGGPGCVHMKYLSQKEGVALNVSYGDSLLHSQTVTDKTKKGTCMDLIPSLAQICARFADLTPTDDGLIGCLNFEPVLFGETTSQYHVGCFRMGPTGMSVDDTLNSSEESEKAEEVTVEDEETTTEEPPAEENVSLFESISQSAEESLAFFSDLLGVSTPTKKKTKTNTTEEAAKKSELNKKRKGKFSAVENLV